MGSYLDKAVASSAIQKLIDDSGFDASPGTAEMVKLSDTGLQRIAVVGFPAGSPGSTIRFLCLEFRGIHDMPPTVSLTPRDSQSSCNMLGKSMSHPKPRLIPH